MQIRESLVTKVIFDNNFPNTRLKFLKIYMESALTSYFRLANIMRHGFHKIPNLGILSLLIIIIKPIWSISYGFTTLSWPCWIKWPIPLILKDPAGWRLSSLSTTFLWQISEIFGLSINGV